MRIDEFIWLEAIIDKLLVKHQVYPDEVEEMFHDAPKFRFIERGQRDGDDVYMALGQTEAGRCLTVLFIYKPPTAEKAVGEALILSARDMADKERRLYGKK